MLAGRSQACPNKDLKKAVGLTSDFLKVVTHQLYTCWNVIEESSSLFSALTTFAHCPEHVHIPVLRSHGVESICKYTGVVSLIGRNKCAK